MFQQPQAIRPRRAQSRERATVLSHRRRRPLAKNRELLQRRPAVRPPKTRPELGVSDSSLPGGGARSRSDDDGAAPKHASFHVFLSVAPPATTKPRQPSPAHGLPRTHDRPIPAS